MAFQSVVTGKDGFGQPTYKSQYGFHVNPTIVTSPVSLYALRDDDLHMGYNIRPVDGTGTTPSDGLWRVAYPQYTDFLTPVDSTKGVVFQTVDDVTFVRAWGMRAPNAIVTRGTFDFLIGGDYLDSIRNIYEDLKRTIPAPFYSPDFERMNGKSGTTALAEGFRVAGNVLVEGFTLGVFQGVSESNHIRPGGFFYDKYSTSKPLAAGCLVDMIKYVDDRIEVVKKEAFVSGLIQAAAMAAAGKAIGAAWDALSNVFQRRNRVRPLPGGPGIGRTPPPTPRLPSDLGPAIAAGTAGGLGGGLLSDLFDGGGGGRGRDGRDGEDGRDGYWRYIGSTRTLEPVYDNIELMMKGSLSIFPRTSPSPISEPASLYIGDLNNYVEIVVGPTQPDIHFTTPGTHSYRFFQGQNEIHKLSSTDAGWTTAEYWSKLNGDCTLKLQVPGNATFPVARRCELLVNGETGATELKNYSVAPTLFKNNSGQPWRFVDVFGDPFVENIDEMTMVQIVNGELTARNPGSTQLVLDTTSLDQQPGMVFKRQGELEGRIEIDNERSMSFASGRDYIFSSVLEHLANDQRPRLYMHVFGLQTKLESTPQDYNPFWTQDGIVHVESYRETPDNLYDFAGGMAGLVCKAWREGASTPSDGALLVEPEGRMRLILRKNSNTGRDQAFSFQTMNGTGNEDTFITHDDNDPETLFVIYNNGRTGTANTMCSERFQQWSSGDVWYPNARHYTAAYFANLAFQPITQDNQYARPTSSVSVDLCVGGSSIDPERYPVSQAYASIWLHKERYGDNQDLDGNPTTNFDGVPALNISVKESGEAIRSSPTLTIYDGVVEVKGDLIVTGSFQGSSDGNQGEMSLNQNVTIDGTLTVNDEVVINNDLTVTGITNLRSDTTINGRLGVGRIDVVGDITAANIECATIRSQAQYTTSDIRKKNIIGRVTNVLDKILDIGVYDFTMKDDKQQGAITGFIAQEVETHFPNLVREDSDGFKSLNYMGIIPLLLQAIQDLSSEVRCTRIDVHK